MWPGSKKNPFIFYSLPQYSRSSKTIVTEIFLGRATESAVQHPCVALLYRIKKSAFPILCFLKPHNRAKNWLWYHLNLLILPKFFFENDSN